jgi:hypothetical protein
MKTLKKDGNYVRVSDTEADEKVKFGWQFCSKSQWKTNVRDFGRKNKKGKEEKTQQFLRTSNEVLKFFNRIRFINPTLNTKPIFLDKFYQIIMIILCK